MKYLYVLLRDVLTSTVSQLICRNTVKLLLNPLTTVPLIGELTLGSISSLLPAYYSHSCASLSVMLMGLLEYCTFCFMLERCGNVNTILLPIKSKTLIIVFWNITLCSFRCRLPITVASCTKIL